MFKITWTTWTESFDREVRSEEVAALLRDLSITHSDPPVMVEVSPVEGPPGRAFTIGIGREDTVLTFQDSADPPYLISMGDSDSDVVMFCWGNEWTEYLGRNVVPLDAGYAALREFLADTGRPTCVQWEAL